MIRREKKRFFFTQCQAIEAYIQFEALGSVFEDCFNGSKLLAMLDIRYPLIANGYRSI